MSSDALPRPSDLPAAPGWAIGIVSVCGVASMVLLAAALVFAHHWGAVADTIVSGWAAATLASAAGVWFLAHRRTLSDRSWRAVRIAGIAVLAAVGVLVFAGVVWAAGGDPASYCGGG
jgi:hypothetical protein